MGFSIVSRPTEGAAPAESAPQSRFRVLERPRQAEPRQDIPVPERGLMQPVTPEGRPIIPNPDGSYSTERSITVTDPTLNDGRATNIPSMSGGVDVTQRQSIDRIYMFDGEDPETGRVLPSFDSIPEAVDAARARSDGILATPADVSREILAPIEQFEPRMRIPELEGAAPLTVDDRAAMRTRVQAYEQSAFDDGETLPLPENYREDRMTLDIEAYEQTGDFAKRNLTDPLSRGAANLRIGGNALKVLGALRSDRRLPELIDRTQKEIAVLQERASRAAPGRRSRMINEIEAKRRGVTKLQERMEESESNLGLILGRIRADKLLAGSIPRHPAAEAALKSESFDDFWFNFIQAPLAVITDIGVESLPVSAPGIIAGVAGGLVAGPLGFAGGMGAGSGAVAFSLDLMDRMEKYGADLNDPESVRAVMEKYGNEIKRESAEYGAVVGIVDGITGRIAAGRLVPVPKAGATGGQVVASGLAEGTAQLAVQGAGGGIGEAAARYQVGDEVTVGEVMAEVVGELVTGPVEIAGAQLSTRRAEPGDPAPFTIPETPPPAPDDPAIAGPGGTPPVDEPFTVHPNGDGTFTVHDTSATAENRSGATFSNPDQAHAFAFEANQRQTGGGEQQQAPTQGRPLPEGAVPAEVILGAAPEDASVGGQGPGPSDPTPQPSTRENLADIMDGDDIPDIIEAPSDSVVPSDPDSAIIPAESVDPAAQQGPAGSLPVGRPVPPTTAQIVEEDDRQREVDAAVPAVRRYIAESGNKLKPEIVAESLGISPETAQGTLTRLAAMGYLQQTKKGVRRRPQATKPHTLLQFLASQGGVRDTGGELAAMNADQWHRGKAFQARLLNPEGMDPDRALELAVEAGYLRDEGRESGGQLQLTSLDLLDAIDREMQGGQPVFSSFDADLVAAQVDREAEETAQLANAEQRTEIREYAADYGEDIDDAAVEEIAKLAEGTGDAESAVADYIERLALQGTAEFDDIVGETDDDNSSLPRTTKIQPPGDGGEFVAPAQGSQSAPGDEGEGAPDSSPAEEAGRAREGPSGDELLAGLISDVGRTAPEPQAEEIPVGQTEPQQSATETVDTADGAREQAVIPGAEQSAQQAQDKRDQSNGGRVRSNAEQQPTDDGLFDTGARAQDDLFDAPGDAASVSEQAENETQAPLPSTDETEGAASVAEKIEVAVEQIDTNPTDAQKEAGTYKKGHVTVHGLDITIENAKGSERSGTDSDGETWSVTMPAHYGYIKRTEGADGDHVDIYLGDNPESDRVFIVDQMDLGTNKFDEHKVILGTGSEADARTLYHAGFSDGKGPDRLGAIREMSVDEFKTWLDEGDQKKPAGDAPGEIPDTLFSLKEDGPRRHGVPSSAGSVIADYRNTQPLRRHKDYAAAKSGDVEASARFVADMVKPESVVAARERFGDNVIYLAIHAMEKNGENAIPLALAQHYAESVGAEAQLDTIVQVNRTFHTGAKAMERMIARPLFDGPVTSGARYVIVDDVTTMGGTIAEAANHIIANGGVVVGAVTLVSSSREGVLGPQRHVVRKIERRFGDAIREIFDVEPAALTADEAKYVLNFRDADELRDRADAAERQRSERLSQEGVRPSEAEDGGVRPDGQTETQEPAQEAGSSVSDEGTTDDVFALGDRPRHTPTEAYAKARDDLKEAISKYIKRVAPHLRGLEFVDDEIRVPESNDNTEQQSVGVGSYSRLDDIIRISMEAQNPSRAARHEVIHHLRNIGVLTRNEWDILSDRASKEWRETYRIDERYGPHMGQMNDSTREAMMDEEAIADAYADWRSGDLDVSGRIEQIFRKIRNFWNRIRNMLRGKGFQNIDDIFSKIDRGDVGGRRAAATTDVPVEQFSIEPGDLDTSEGRQRAMQRGLSAGQPIDRMVRLPFSIFGGLNEHGEWKPGARLFDNAKMTLIDNKIDPEGRFGWLSTPIEVARAGLIDRYGLSDEFIRRERQRDKDERTIMLSGVKILDSLKDQDVSVEEAQILQAVLTGEAVADEKWETIAVPIRQAIDDLGAEAVQLGLLSPESFERNRGSYLHRVYAKHERDQGGLARWVGNSVGKKRRQIIGDQFKGRGLFLEIPVSALAKEGASVAPGDMYSVFDPPAAEDGSRAGRRKYIRSGDEKPPGLADHQDNGVWEVRALRGEKATLWRDFTKSERASMGELLDARYTIGRTFMTMAHDLATGRFHSDIASNSAWAQDDEPSTKWVDAADYRRRWADPSVDWVKVPETTIPDSAGKKQFGNLAGKYVRAEIWRDLNELDLMMRPGFWRKMMTQWKLNKTARSPVVHLNNVMSNLMFMDLADVRAQDLVAGVRAFVKETPDYQEAVENGAFGSDMMSQEIRRSVLGPILDDLEAQSNKGRSALHAKFGTAGMLVNGLWRKLRAADGAMIDAYRMEDEIFRMAMYMRRRKQGDTPGVAAESARQQFLDYDIRAPWVNAARQTVLPFIAYSYRAVPLIARSIATRPWKLAKYFAMAYAINALAYMATGDDDEEQDRERRSMRPEERGYTWVGVPRMMRMPYRDEHGNPVFLDIRRWIPAGDVFDTKQGSSAIPIPAPLQFGGPIMLAAEMVLDKQAFTGDEITNELTDDWFDKAGNIGDWAWKSWMPSAAWVPGSWYWTKIGRALEGGRDHVGRPLSLTDAALSSVGVKLKPQDVEENFARRAFEFSKVERELKAQGRRLARDRERNLLSQKAFDREMQSLLAKFNNLQERAEQTFSSNDPQETQRQEQTR